GRPASSRAPARGLQICTAAVTRMTLFAFPPRRQHARTWPEDCMIAALALLLAVLAATPAAAADYWVKNGGSDVADGLSAATAFPTLQHAADLVDPGDTVHVLDGSYQGFYLDRSGLSGQPITFRAEGSAALITSDNGTTPDGINLEGASFVVIDGFVVND